MDADGRVEATVALVYATASGRAHAQALERRLEGARLYDGRPSEALEQAFSSARQVVLFLATGAAVRLIAPLLGDKHTDPGIVCVDDRARYAIALCGAHSGGANELAHAVAAVLGSEPIVTTATDSSDVPALESLGAHLGLRLAAESDVAAVASAVVSGEPVALVQDRRLPLEPLPQNVCEKAEDFAPAIIVSDRSLARRPRPSVIYRPPSLVIGVGCESKITASEIKQLIAQTLSSHGLSADSVWRIATIDIKAGEQGLVQAAAALGTDVVTFTAAELAEISVPNPSAAVERAVRTPSVAEAAALRGATADDEQPPELICEKQKSKRATVAIARRSVRGRLALVSLGPGDESLIPERARRELRRSRVVMGLTRYVESISHLLRPGTRTVCFELGEEIERSQAAVAEAAGGESVALVSGGDVGVYAMASPALEQAQARSVEVSVVPGIASANACAALTGAPLSHDHCAISLSDLLTPWELIAKRLEAAGEADLVTTLYNPRSARRTWQLQSALSILARWRAPSTPVAIVSDAFRPDQNVLLTTLESADPQLAGMTTTVIVGSSKTRVFGGRMVTPRGYLEPAGKAKTAELSG